MPAEYAGIEPLCHFPIMKQVETSNAFSLRTEYAFDSKAGFYYVQITHRLRIGRRDVMKTRADIYGKEAAELLREISMYPGLSEQQLVRFYPGKEDKIRNLLVHLQRQGRTVMTEAGSYFPQGEHTRVADAGLIRSVWVLLYFIDRVEFHSPSDFPVKLLFFSAGEVYEVVYVAAGQESLINQALRKCQQGESRRIVLVDDAAQIPLLDFPDISGFCTVEPDGIVSYYKKSEGGA